MRAEMRARRDAFLDKIRSGPAVMGILNVTAGLVLGRRPVSS